MIKYIKHILKAHRDYNKPAELFSPINFAGHKFTPLGPGSMTKARHMAIARGENTRGWGVEKKDLINIFDTIQASSNDPKKVFHYCENSKSLIAEDFQYYPFLQAASFMILMDDETNEKINTDYNSLKVDLCIKHPELAAFFLAIILSFTRNMKLSLSTSQAWEYLKEGWRLDTEKIVYSQLIQNIGLFEKKTGSTSK